MSKNTQIRENYKYKKIFLKKKTTNLNIEGKNIKNNAKKKKEERWCYITDNEARVFSFDNT